MSTTTIDSITDYFLNSSIHMIEGETTYETIKQAEKNLIENKSSTQSTLGAGNHGFLGLTLTPEKYFTVTSYTFQPHVNPSTLLIKTSNATQHQI